MAEMVDAFHRYFYKISRQRKILPRKPNEDGEVYTDLIASTYYLTMGKGKDVADCCVACGAAAVCCLVVLIVIGLLGLGIAKIVMGAVYLHDCSIEKLIPIYLIVSGVAPIFFGGFSRGSGDEDSGSDSMAGTVCGTIGLLFNLAWLICGSVWVYPNYGIVTADDFRTCTANVTTDCTVGDCSKPLITFAFAMVTIDWIMMGLWIAVLGCAIVRLCCKAA